MKKYLILVLTLATLASACNGGGSSNAPTATTQTTKSGPQVLLNWSASSGSPAGYYVAQSTDGNSFSIVKTVFSNTATISGVTSGTTYYYKVQAYNSGGNSAFTSAVSVTAP